MRDFQRPGRSAVFSGTGMVATSHPTAARVGTEILAAGGNAIDAAIATAVVLGIAEPQMTGLGGDMFALVHKPGAGMIGLNASGRAPAGLSADRLRAEGLSEIPAGHPASITLPGAVDGFCRLHADHGRLPLDATLAPAIRYASSSFRCGDAPPWIRRPTGRGPMAQPCLKARQDAGKSIRKPPRPSPPSFHSPAGFAMPQTLTIKKHAPSGTIILNRPDKRNALTRLMLCELAQALDDFHLERSVRAVILTGAGTAFCAGMDLQEMRETAESESPLELWESDAVQYREVIDKMLQFPKPIIAAVNGPALAGGGGLLLASDLVVAGAGARFGLPEPQRGIVAGIVAPLLAFRLGAGRAARLLLLADLIDAEEAHRLGLFQELVGDDQVWARAHQLAEQVALSAPEAIQLTKKMLNETIGEHLGTLLSAGAAASATARTTEAAAEGLQAFLEKREPKWA